MEWSLCRCFTHTSEYKNVTTKIFIVFIPLRRCPGRLHKERKVPGLVPGAFFFPAHE